MDKIEELGKAFEEFKKTHVKELAEIKKNGVASAETSEKMAKMQKSMDDLEVKIGQTAALLNRSDRSKEENETKEAKEKAVLHKRAVEAYLRKGKIDLFTKDMTVDSDQDGGFFVNPEMSAEIVTKVWESSPMRALASVQTISSDSLEIMQDLDQAGSGWVQERGSRTVTTTPKFNQVKIATNELYAEPQASQKMLDDASINIESYLAQKVADKFGRDEATAFISGNGVGKPMGILSYGSTTDSVGDPFGLVQQVVQAATGHTTIINFDDIFDVQTALKEPYQANASWLCNRIQIGGIRKLKDSQNRYLWEPGLQVGAPATLLGRPIFTAADLPSVLTVNTVGGLVYGDFKAAYQIVDRIGIRVLRDPFTAKPFVLFYTTKRVGGGVKNFEALKILTQAAS